MTITPIKFTVFLLLSFLLTASNYVIASDKTATTSLLKQLRQLNTYQANFTQRVYDKTGRIVQQGRGTVKIKKPGLFLWKTEAPLNQVITINQGKVWIYDVDLAQATEQTFDLKQQVFNPVMLLSGQAQTVINQFTIRLLPGGKTSHFMLKPKTTASGYFHWVILAFKQNRLTELVMENNLQQQVHYQFSAIQQNRPIASSVFQLTLPKSVEIIKN